MQNKNAVSENLPNYFSTGWMVVISLSVTFCLNWPTMDSHFWHTFTHSWYLIAFLNTFSNVLIIVTFTNSFTGYLDSKLLWEDGFWKRLIYQSLLGFMVPVSTCYLLGSLSFYFFDVNMGSTRYIRNMYSLLVLICITINLLHIVYYYVFRSTVWLKHEAVDTKPNPIGHLFIPEGKGQKKILTTTVAYIFVEKGTTYIQHHNGELDICFIALDNIYNKLDHASFFRATRSYVVSKTSVEGYTRAKDKGLSVTIHPKTREPIYISRLKASQFIKWLKTAD